MRAMLGYDEEAAGDREGNEYLFDTSAYYVLMRLALLVHDCFLVARKVVDPVSSRQCEFTAPWTDQIGCNSGENRPANKTDHRSADAGDDLAGRDGPAIERH